jgi:Carboxypeptidase regulatory-like domain
VLVVAVAGSVLDTGHLAAQQVRGRVVDEQFRRPVLEAEVVLALPDGTEVARTVTTKDGYFQLSAEQHGRYILRVDRLGFDSETRTLNLEIDQDLVVPAFVLRTKAIELDSVAIEASRDPKPDAATVGFSRKSFVIAGSRLARLEEQGARMITILRELPGIRVREYSVRGRAITCIESNRRFLRLSQDPADSPCPNVVWVMDDVPTDNDWSRLRSFDVVDFESVEYLPPVEAGSRYGMMASAYGAVVLWTRGRGPHVSSARGMR